MSILENRSKQYDVQLQKIEHYQKHPQMIPFIGCNYGKKKKLLIVGESHFCHEGTDKNIVENWYNINSSNLNQDLVDFTSTSVILNYNINEDRFYGSHKIYYQIYSAIKETGFVLENLPDKYSLTYISYMNFFQRPALQTGDSIKTNKKDIEIAISVFNDVRKIIQPDYIFFVSKLAYNNCFVNDKNDFGHSCHPCCSWWNRKCSKYTKPKEQNSITGKESFKYFIKANKIFD